MKALQQRDKATDYEKLEEVISGQLDEQELTEHLEEKLERVRMAHAMLLGFQSGAKITKKLCKKYFKISQSQAWRDIQLTEKLFGAQRKANKEFKRLQAEEMALETYRMAKKQKKPLGMAAANKNFIVASGANINDPDMPEFEKLEPVVNIMVISPQVESILLQKLNAGPVRWTPPVEPKEYIEYDEVDNASGDDQ